jgi:hypothetical protein
MAAITILYKLACGAPRNVRASIRHSGVGRVVR